VVSDPGAALQGKLTLVYVWPDLLTICSDAFNRREQASENKFIREKEMERWVQTLIKTLGIPYSHEWTQSEEAEREALRTT
jgi:Mitochondrial ATPase inhibitor, IATP